MAVTVKVNAVDVSSRVTFSTLHYSNKGFAATGVCNFTIVDQSGSLSVNPEHEVLVEDGATVLFKGKIRNRVRTQTGSGSRRFKTYRVTAQDVTSYLFDDVCEPPDSNRGATETDKQRIEWLLSTFGSKGINGGTTVQAVYGTLPEAQDFTGMNLYEAIEAVAAYSGAEFYVDFDLNLHYFDTETNDAPHDLSDSPNGTTTFKYADLELPDDTADLVNAVLVIGADGVTPVFRTDSASITAYERREGSIRDASLQSTTALNAAGDAYLAQNANPRGPATLKTWEPGLRAGQYVQLTNSTWGITAVEHRITQVDLSIIGDNTPEFRVTLNGQLSSLADEVQRGDVPGNRGHADAQDVAAYAATISPVLILGALPTLPDPDYPIGTLVFYTVDEKVYRNASDVWTVATDGADIIANSITGGKIQAGAISASEIATGTITTNELAAGQISLYDNAGEVALEPAGFGPTWQRFLQSGFFNGDLRAATPSLGSDIDDGTNALPHWSFQQASGTAITARVIADATLASAFRVDFSMAAGAAGDDSYLQQIVPIVADASQSFVYQFVSQGAVQASGGPGWEGYMKLQYLKKDLTTTGSEQVQAGTTAAAAGLNSLSPPVDAAYARTRIGLRRAGASNSTTATVSFYAASVRAFPFALLFADEVTPTNAPASIGYQDGDLGFDNGPTIVMRQATLNGVPELAVRNGTLRVEDGLLQALGVPIDVPLTASSSGSTATLTTTRVDVPGCSITMPNPGAIAGEEYWLVFGTFDVDITAGGNSVFRGELQVGAGAEEAEQALFKIANASGGRATIGQTWLVGPFSQSFTLKLRASINTGGSTMTTGGPHTTIKAWRIASTITATS